MPYPVAAAQGGMLRLSGGGGLTFLLRDDFTTAAGAPLTSPRSSEPGPGTLTITDTNSKLSVASGKLTFATGGVGNGNPGAWGSGLSRIVGRASMAEVNVSAAGIEAGWDINQVSNPNEVVRLTSGDTLQIRTSATALTVGAYALGASYKIATVLRDTGAFYFIKGGAFTEWTLLYVGGVDNTDPMYPALVAVGATSAGTSDFLRVLDLAAPFDTDYGLATQRLAGAQSAGVTFVHEANCVIEWTVGGSWVWGAGFDQVQVTFRRQDANNYWELSGDNYGTVRLKEYVGGTPTTRGTAGTSSVPFRVVVVAEGSTIRVYSKNVLLFTYSSASNFATETDGSVAAIGAAGSVSDLIAWPRTLSGAAAALLDAAIA